MELQELRKIKGYDEIKAYFDDKLDKSEYGTQEFYLIKNIISEIYDLESGICGWIEDTE